jgi:5'-3' exonuclease
MKRVPGKKRSLVIDISNILFRVAAVQKQSPYGAADVDPQDLVGLCMHISLQSIFKYYEKFRPDVVVFAFEGGDNWRKEYTAKVRSRLAYKGNRVYDPAMEHFYKLMNSFKETISSHTSIICLNVPGMEADDAIGGYAQIYANPEHEVFIVSGDRDFTQLTRDPDVKLVNPDNGKLRNQPGDKNYEPDIEYWLFLKCVRGDMGDYVPSAWPRVRETKIRKAYENEYDRINFMNATWEEPARDDRGLPVLNEDGSAKLNKYRVGDLYDENKILVDLRAQPEPLRTYLLEEVKKQVENVGNYSHFHFLRFLNSFNLSNVAQNATKFADMFSHNQRYRKGEAQPVLERAAAAEKRAAREDQEETPAQRTNLLSF